MLRLFPEIIRARFLTRPNRFLVKCEIEGRRVDAFLPNPGRLHELLLPDAVIYLVVQKPAEQRKTVFTVVAVERAGRPIMLHTHRNNDVARYLLDRGKVPGLEKARIVRAEAPLGHSRFDFLLADSGGEIYVEVKSCTLVGKETAMFPDAVTARGTRHLLELQDLSKKGVRTAVLFVVHWPLARFFMPDYHTDLHFSRTLLNVQSDVKIIPLAVTWHHDLSLDDEVRPLVIPWAVVEKEALDRGSYLLILHLKKGIEISVGKLGKVFFREGYYVYVGSAMSHLSKRVERHMRLRKRHHWHIDELRAVSEVRAVLPVRASDRLECMIADSMASLADWQIPRFGATDCMCPTHLFGTIRDPLESSRFQGLLQYFRMDRLELEP